jgi:outer membrane protein assembly factor BamB
VKRKAFAAAAGLVLLGGGAGIAFVVVRQHEARNIRGSSTVEFVPTETIGRIPQELKSVQWPMYGFNEQRTHAAGGDVRPPFERVWVAGGNALLEFPPVIGYGRLFLANNSGLMMAVGAANGGRAWKYRSHRCVAATPAVSAGTVYEAFLNHPPCNANPSPKLDGEVIAFSTGLGKIRWRKRMGPTETSPLLANGLVYVGDWRGDVYALSEKTGEVRWRYHVGGPVKGGIALSGNRVFFGAYDSHVYAVYARTGKPIWKASAQPRLGGRGDFYSTPAVAYGRVYIGSNDGKVYSFGATSGKLRWSHSTGGYVYGSPAVWRGRVLIGSYSKKFYALDAATGDVIWTFKANGKISGSATVIGDVVYFATLKGRTYGLDARTGRQLWTFPDGKYSPVVADATRLYLVGYAKLYGLVPQKAAKPAAKPHRLSVATVRALVPNGVGSTVEKGKRITLIVGPDRRPHQPRAYTRICNVEVMRFAFRPKVRRTYAEVVRALHVRCAD